MTDLKPHQQRVIDKLNAPNGPHGIIAYHSLGSGKTYTALAAMQQALKDNPGKRGLIVAPASLITNVEKEVTKHNIKGLDGKVDVLSYERAANQSEKLLKNNYALAVFDEAHRLRNNSTKRVQNLTPIIDKSDKVLLLTGTAGYNHPSDVTNLINLLDARQNLPATRKGFEDKYIDNRTWKLKDDGKLRKVLRTYVDKYDTPTNSKDYPTVEREVYHVEMTPRQAATYDIVKRSIPVEIRAKLKANLPLTLQEANQLNFFSTGVRQVSNTPTHHDVSAKPEDSPKLQLAASNLVDDAKGVKGFRAVAYSNFLDAGLDPYKVILERQGIKPLMFTGSMSAKAKKSIIDEYNSKSKDPKVLLLSSSGGEGLDLKRTRVVQILEPHFNKSKIQQVEGRAIRYKSHADLPSSQRNVKIEEYRAVLPQTTFQRFYGSPGSPAIDDHLAELSDKKQGIVDEMDKLIMK